MRRRIAAHLQFSFAFPLAFLIPILLAFYATDKLTLLFRLSYLALPITVLYCLFPKNKKQVTGGNGQAPAFFSWACKLWLIEFGALFLFLGTARTLYNYLSVNNLISATAQPNWLASVVHFTFFNWGLFPGAMLALASAIYIKTAQKHPRDPQHLTRELSNSKKLYGWLTRRTGDYYFMFIGRVFQSFVIAIAVLCLSHYFYPTYCNFLHPLPGMTTAAIILITLTLKKSEKLYLSIQEHKTAPYKHLLALLILTTVISIILSLAFHHFVLPYKGNWISRWKTLKILPATSTKTLTELLCFCWWIVALPILSSMVCFYSQGKSIRLMLGTLLIPPFVLGIITYFLPSWLNILTQNTSGPLFIGYLASLILFFFSLRKASSNQITWFGYLPNRPMKKLRVTNPRLVWLLVPIWLGLISVSGIDGIILLGLVGAIPLLFFYLYLSLRNFP